jgi:hypothetical protein
MNIIQILIKDYKEYAADDRGVLVAKEVEAVIQLEGEVFFSLGFSVLRDNPIFQLEAPRDMVRSFLLKNNFFQTGNNEPPSE